MAHKKYLLITLIIFGLFSTAFIVVGFSNDNQTNINEPADYAITDTPPNVLFIVIDDLNDWIGSLGGHPDVKTPHMDRLANRGVLFQKAYSSAPACNPSRASLLSGILPSTSGIYHNRQPAEELYSTAVPLPLYFKKNGYKTLGVGKIFHTNEGDPENWDEYFTIERDSTVFRHPQNTVPVGAVEDWRLAGGPMDIEDDDMKDAVAANWASEQLGKKHDKPFFLTVGFFRPHIHWFAPKKYFDMYPLGTVTLPKVSEEAWHDLPPLAQEIARSINDHEIILENDQWEKGVISYLANVSFIDAMVGRVIDALDESEYGKNTIIVLTSDHGFHLGEKLHWRKFTLWEEGNRVPLIVIAPGITEPGTTSSRPVSLVDIYPTLIDLSNLPVKNDLDGQSLKPLLQNPDIEWERPALTTYGQNNHSLRTEQWRYTRYSDGTEELYNHFVDSLEWHNLANDPEYSDIKKEISQWFPTINVPDPPDVSFWHIEFDFLEGLPIHFQFDDN